MDTTPNELSAQDGLPDNHSTGLPVSDQELLNRLSSGDELSLAELYKRYSVSMRARAYFVTRDEQLTSDTVHYTFIRLMWQGNKMRQITDLRKWLNDAAWREAEQLKREPAYQGMTFKERAAKRFNH